MRCFVKPLSVVLLVAVTGASGTAAPQPTPEQAAAQHASALSAARAEYAKASGGARTESEKQLAAAKAAYDAATRQANEAYLKSLEQDFEREMKAGHERSANAIRQQINLLTNGPPRSEVQKLWIASFAAEADRDYEASIAAVKKLILVADVGKNPFVQMRLGWLNYLDGDYEEGAAAYKKSVAAAPAAVTPRLGLVNCYLALNRIDDALEAANAILKIDPLNYRASKTLGDLYYVREDYTRSLSHYLRLSTAYPDDLQIAAYLGWCYLKLGERDLALRIFADVLAIQPDNLSASNGFAEASPQQEASAKTSEPSEEGKEAEEKIVIRNPPSARLAVRYTLNGQYPVTLKPGTAQTLDTARTWTIRFDQNKGRPMEERLEAGEYEFHVDNGRTRLAPK